MCCAQMVAKGIEQKKHNGGNVTNRLRANSSVMRLEETPPNIEPSTTEGLMVVN